LINRKSRMPGPYSTSYVLSRHRTVLSISKDKHWYKGKRSSKVWNRSEYRSRLVLWALREGGCIYDGCENYAYFQVFKGNLNTRFCSMNLRTNITSKLLGLSYFSTQRLRNIYVAHFSTFQYNMKACGLA
jgi:hypothetical protein